RRWGCHNLELPISLLCQTESFAWFTCHLLMEADRFHSIYNTSVQDYRRLYGIRSRHHPVPDLAVQDDWRELPFWAWRTGQRQRGRLLVRRTETRVELRAGTERWPDLPVGSAADRSPLVEAFRRLEAGGFKIRPRALTN